MPGPPASSSPLWRLVKVAAGVHVVVYRASRGRIGGRLRGAPILLLHHVGRQSGRARVTPVLYLTDDANFVVVASKAGTDKHPSWFHNVIAGDEVLIEVGRTQQRVRPHVASASERGRLWPRAVDIYPQFADYQLSAGTRTIPLVVLEPVRS